MTPLTKDTPVRTRDGREAEILATDMGGEWQILARVRDEGGGWDLLDCTSEGLVKRGCVSCNDLIPIRPERVVWINEYADVDFGVPRLCKRDADRMQTGIRLALHRITLSEDTIYRGDDE